MFNLTTILKMRNNLCAISAATALFAFGANAEDNNPMGCASILATIPGGNNLVTTAGPANGVYDGGQMPIATLTFTSTFMPNQGPNSPSFKVAVNGAVSNQISQNGQNTFEIFQDANFVGTKAYSVVIAQQEQNEGTWCYKTATGVSITVTQAACQPISSVSVSATKSSITLVGDDMNMMQFNEQIMPTIVGGNFFEFARIANGVEDMFLPFQLSSSLSYGASYQEGSGTKTYAYKFRNACSTITSNTLSLNVTTVASLPCVPINFIGSDAPSTIPGLMNGQLQATLNTNTTFSGNYLDYAWSLNGQAVMQPMPSSNFSAYNLNIGTNTYSVTVSGRGNCTSLGANVRNFTVNVITVTALPCQQAPTIFEFGFDIGGGTRVNTRTITQCGNGGISHNIGEGSDGPNDINGLRFVYYKDGNEIGGNYSNYFNISTSLAGTSIYTMKAINNCGTTTSPLNLNTSITIQGNLTSCGNNNGGGNGGSGNGTGSGVNCSKPTTTGMSNTNLSIAAYANAEYTVTASTQTGSITGYIWYKALPGFFPPLTNISQVGIVFGNTNKLIIMYATADDAGYYAVSAMNSCGRDSEPHFFNISVAGTIAGFVPTLPAVAPQQLGGDFAKSFTVPGFVAPIDNEGNFDLVWEDVVGVNTEKGDTYCVRISVTPDFSKFVEFCNLTSSGLSLTVEQLNSISGALKPNAREEAEAKQEYYYKVAPKVNGFTAAYSAPAKKVYQNASLQSITGVSLADSNVPTAILVYPNPNSGSFTVVANGEVVIYNILGSKVKSFVAAGATQVSGLSQGIYIVSTSTQKVKLVVE